MAFRKLLLVGSFTAGICITTTSVQAATLISEFTLPEGNTILQVAGADAIGTGGGTAISDTQTLYYFEPDFGNPQPNFPDYTGEAWPYIYVDQTLEIEESITAEITTENDGVGDLVLINGSPVYQFVNDIAETDANGNIGPWTYVEPDGIATQRRDVPEPHAVLGILLALGLGSLFTKKTLA
ncbi:MAG: PEP-CTERM sorting domain-containing protein [Cyanobacteria bacterium J06636_16]